MKKLFEEAMNVAKTYDVSTPRNRLVLYSISFLPTKVNRENAREFVHQHPQFVLMEHTPCGKKLEEMKLSAKGSGLTSQEVAEIWRVASKRLIQNASGSVKAFVDGADPKSTFRCVELPALLENPKITTINGENKYIYARRIKF